jgi:hypothetical protein
VALRQTWPQDSTQQLHEILGKPHQIAGGNRAKAIRRRFDAADIGRPLAIAWWDWPLGLISESVRAIMAASFDDLEAAIACCQGMVYACTRQSPSMPC